MDRNSIIGLLLIAVVVVTFSVFNQPSKEQLETLKRQRDSIEAVEKAKHDETLNSIKDSSSVPAAFADTIMPNDSARALLLEQQYGVFGDAALGEEEIFTLQNEKLKATFSSRGGRIISVELLNYKTFDQKPLLLFDKDSSGFGLNFFAQNRNISTSKFFFRKTQSTDSTLSFSLAAGSGSLTYHYTIHKNSFLVSMDIEMKGLQHIVAQNSNSLELDWHQHLLKTERDMQSERHYATVFYKYAGEDAEKLSETSDQRESLVTKVKWVAFKQHFFTSAIIAADHFEKPSIVETVSDEGSPVYIRQCKAILSIPFNHREQETTALTFYFGPNHFQTLKHLDLGMEKLISLGFFGFVNRWLVIPVFNWLNSFNLNFGIIILILTILIRIILLPLTYKSFLATAKMRVLQPEVTAINEKYPDDPMKKQQELMNLYRRAGVNPLGGCIPALLQIPILFAMFSFFPSSIELRQESFLWAKDLSTYDSILELPFHIPFYGSHVSLFTLLMTASTLLYTSINMQMTTATNPQMKWMMYLMPIMFLGVFNSYSAGLSYYYFLSNLCGLGQQFLFKSFVNQDEIHRKIQENKKKPVQKSKFQQRLEKMAKERGYKSPGSGR